MAVTTASIGSAFPNTHLYLAPEGNSGRVRIVNCTCKKTKSLISEANLLHWVTWHVYPPAISSVPSLGTAATTADYDALPYPCW
jgi:hypothetical protein